jgi:HKD family nuclease
MPVPPPLQDATLARLIALLPKLTAAASQAGARDGQLGYLVAGAAESADFIYPFDWGAWSADEGAAFFTDPDAIARATLDDLRRLMTCHVRKERFCEGHLASVSYEHWCAILRRAEVLVSRTGAVIPAASTVAPTNATGASSEVRLVSSPGESYARELIDALSSATSFVLVTGFASVAGIGVVGPAVRAVLERGGQGRIIIAVDRQGFNAASVFEALLALKDERGARLSLGVVLEGAGLLHAKALFTQGPAGERLLVGSANLTRSALGTNHELGLLISSPPADVRRAFHRFVTSIAPRSLDGADARPFLEARGLLPTVRMPRVAPSGPAGATAPLSTLIQRLPALPPLELSPDEHVASWIARGYLVGRGRRSLDALVLRLPHEQLARQGHIRPPQREVLGIASHETRTMGYGVDLLPTINAEALRRSARRVTFLLAKLTLSLPCFGNWMPESYWDVFIAARQKLQGAASIDPDAVRHLAAQHRVYLDQGGLEAEVDQILRRLGELELLVPDRGPVVREFLVARFGSELRLRTPDSSWSM